MNANIKPKATTPHSFMVRQQAIEDALTLALHLARCGDIHAATGRAIRAASMLKQACAEFAEEGGAA